jgi:hypothetical protein
MKKITLLIACLGFVTVGMAQVKVKGDTFIYSKGTDIYITKGLVLENAPSATDKTGSAFYLRDEAQLIQGDPAAIASGDPIGNNGGAGTFSVFQEGVANNFTYNYWSSPVSDPSLMATGGGFKNTQIYFPLLTKGLTDVDKETDLVINAKQATIFPINVRDGRTDRQSFDTSGDATVSEDLRIASRWLYSYNSVGDGAGGGYSGWTTFQSSTAAVGPGYGFTMKGVILDSGADVKNIKSSTIGSGQRYDFRGIPNSGDISVSVKNGDFSLVGNPYPSALNLQAFMLDETNKGKINGELYFWDSRSTNSHTLIEYVGGYGTYVPDDSSGGNGMYTNATFTMVDNSGNPTGVNAGDGSVGDGSVSRGFAAIGQGFVIQRTVDESLPDTSTSTTGTVIFKNIHRVFQRENTDSSIFKSATGSGNDQTANASAKKVRPKIRFNTYINNLYNRNMILAFGDDATTGWDWGKDGSNNANRVATDTYMPIEGKQSIIQTIPNITDETTVPLAFQSSVNYATFKIQVTSLENFETNQILIHDKETNTYHDILNDSYTIEIGKGEVKDRYEIVFQEKTTLSTGEVAVEEGYNIFQNNQQSLLTVRNANSQDVANISVFDLSGRLVTSSNPTDIRAEYTFNTASYATGIYIVKVTTADDAEIATKVVVSN